MKPLPPEQRKKKSAARVLANGLTTEQEAYCRARAMGMDLDEAMATSNIKLSNATVYGWHKKNPLINQRIEELTGLAAKSAILNTGLDRQWVISRLMKIVERCMTTEPVLNKEGEQTGVFEFDPTAATNALKLLGMELNMFRPTEKKLGDEYDQLSDDDLTRVITGLAAEIGIAQIVARTQAPPGSQQVIEVSSLPPPN